MGENAPIENTFGEDAVSIDYTNNVSDEVLKVNSEVLKLYAKIIDILDNERIIAGHGEQGRNLSVAITQTQTASMWAVKGITSGESLAIKK